MEASVVSSASTMTSTGTVVANSVGGAVVGFVVSTTCFSVVALAMVGSSASMFTFLVDLVACKGEVVFSVFFPVTTAVEVLSRTVAVAGLALVLTPTFVVAAIRGSVETASVSLAAVVTGASVATPVSTLPAIVSASVATDVVDASLVCTTGAAVLSGVAVSVTDFMGTPVLALVVTVEASVATFVSTLISTGSDIVVTVGAAVVALVLSTISFPIVAWGMEGSLNFLATFCEASVVCTGKNVLAASFSLTAALDVFSTMVAVVGLVVLVTSAFVVTSVRGSVKTTSVSLKVIVTAPLLVIPVVMSTAVDVLSSSPAADIVDASVNFSPGAADVRRVVLSVNVSVDTIRLGSLATMEASFVTSGPRMTSTGTVVIVSVDAAVVDFFV